MHRCLGRNTRDFFQSSWMFKAFTQNSLGLFFFYYILIGVFFLTWSVSPILPKCGFDTHKIWSHVTNYIPTNANLFKTQTHVFLTLIQHVGFYHYKYLTYLQVCKNCVLIQGHGKRDTADARMHVTSHCPVKKWLSNIKH